MWRDGPVVGELVAVGAAKGDGLVGRLRGHRAHARAPHHRPERVGRRCSPVPAARAPAPRRRSRPSRSRSRRCPACACPEAPAARSPTARWPRAGSWPTTGACRPAGARRSTRSCARRSRCPSRAAPPARSSTPSATRPSPSSASRPGCSSRCRSPSSATTRRRAAAPRRSASTRAAATARPSPRRAASSASAAAARPRRSSPPRSSTACRSSSPGAPTACRPSTRRARGSARAARPTPAASSPRTAPRAYRKAYATYVDEPATPLDHRTYDAIGFFAHLSTTGSGALASFADAMRAPSLAQAYPDVAREGAAGLFDTWASSLYRAPQRGAAWDVSGPCAPPRASAADPTPIVLGNRSSGDHHGGRVRRAPLRALRRPLGGERHPRAPRQRSPARRLGRPRRPAPERRHLLPLARRPRRQPGHRPQWRHRRREGHHHGHRRRPGLRSRRHGELPDAALPGLRRQLDRAARDRPRDPARALRQPDPGRERQAGHAGEHLEHLRPRRSEPAGLHDQHQLRPGPDRPVQDHGQRRATGWTSTGSAGTAATGPAGWRR